MRLLLLAIMSGVPPFAFALAPTSQPSLSPTTSPLHKGIPTLAANAPDAVKNFWAAQPRIKKGVLDNLAKIEQQRKTDVANARHPAHPELQTYRQHQDAVAAAEAALQKIELSIRTIKSAPYIYPTLTQAEDCKDGFIGRLPECQMKQVVDSQNAILKLSFVGSVSVDGTPNFIERDLWISVFDTTGYADETKFSPSPVQTVWIDGTHNFGTAIGASRTILSCKPFDINDWLKWPASPSTSPSSLRS